jgi:hypothetical protein
MRVISRSSLLAAEIKVVFPIEQNSHSGRNVPNQRDEDRATKAAAALLRDDPQLKRKKLEDLLRARGHNISGQGFKTRIWPNARAAANLTPHGRPGRPKGSSAKPMKSIEKKSVK